MSRIEDLREHYAHADISGDFANAEYVPADTPPESERMTTFAVRLPVPVLERVRQIANDEGATTSAVLRRWVDAGIAEHDKDDPDDASDSLLEDILLVLLRKKRERRRKPRMWFTPDAAQAVEQALAQQKAVNAGFAVPAWQEDAIRVSSGHRRSSPARQVARRPASHEGA